MANTPLVSVIIPVFNGERFLRETLESVLAQTYRPLEVIAVNDGSTDSSQQILSEYAGRIRYSRQENAGQAAARNRALSEARGDWIAFIDQDDVWDPCKLQRQLAAVADGDDLIHTNLRVVDGRGKIIEKSCWEPRHDEISTLAGFLEHDPVHILTVLVRRGALEDIGGFDSSNRFGTDDLEAWLQLLATGHTFRYLDEVLASYRVHGSNMSQSDHRRGDLGYIYALEKTGARYPDAFGRHELLSYHRRLRHLRFDVGWHDFDREDYASAAEQFRHALRHGPFAWRTWLYVVATMLPFRTLVLPRLRAWATGRKARNPA